jgi:hypothetical protein
MITMKIKNISLSRARTLDRRLEKRVPAFATPYDTPLQAIANVPALD